MKLTLDIQQIDTIIDLLEEYNFEVRIQQEKEKASQFNKLIFLVVDQFRELLQKSWIDRMLQDRNEHRNSSAF